MPTTWRAARRRLAGAALGLAAGCATASAQPVLRQASDVIAFAGACEASAAVMLPTASGGRMLVVANDGDNVLRAYDPARGGTPQEVASLDDHLAIPPGDRGRGRGRADIEAAAVLDGRVFWLGSHSRENDHGELRRNRHHLFATRDRLEPGAAGGLSLAPVGAAPSLVAALSQPALGLGAALGLDSQGTQRERDAAAKAESGGLNIEGLAAGTEPGSLLIGLRSPLVGGQAALLRLANPVAVVEQGAAPRLTRELLALGGRGIRSIEQAPAAPAARRYVIVAGSATDGDDFTLFQWSGQPGAAPVEIPGAAALLRTLAASSDKQWGEDFRFGPEALVLDPEARTLLLLSDDGDRRVDGRRCQHDATPAARRSFRGVLLRLD